MKYLYFESIADLNSGVQICLLLKLISESNKMYFIVAGYAILMSYIR